MARRIALPSADVLFGDKPGGKARETAAKPKQATPKPATAKKDSKSRKPSAAPRAPQRRRATPETRLAAIESRLPELPVDALIDLRDNLEDLLAADTLDEAAVRRLLDSVQA